MMASGRNCRDPKVAPRLLLKLTKTTLADVLWLLLPETTPPVERARLVRSLARQFAAPPRADRTVLLRLVQNFSRQAPP